MRDLVLTLGLVVLVTLAGPPAAAQQASPAADEVYIENLAPQQLTFGLSNDNESWDRFTLVPSEVAIYGGSEIWYFLILTEGVELRYRLDGGGSYRLYWNDADLRWDMMSCQEPVCGRVADAAP